MGTDLITESYKAIQEWGKWLVTIEITICTLMWPKLTSTPKPPDSLYLGWSLFIASIVITAIMLGLISFFIQRSNVKAEQDGKLVKILVILQYLFFLGGLMCFGTRVLGIWTSN
jgi:hypothetical protein